MKIKLYFILILPFFLCTCQKEDISAERIVQFNVEIDTSNPNNESISSRIEYDRGVLMFPLNYKETGTPTKLIIYCHSAGGSVLKYTNEMESNDYCKYLCSLGYAVMSMAGMPESFAEKLHIDYYRNLGSYIAVRSCFEGYKYVIKKYNIDSKGCYILCNSHGGLLSLNIGTLTDLPIIAQIGIAPLLSVEKNAWNIPSGSLLGGEFNYRQNRANIIRIYGMKEIKTEIDLNNAKYEKEKIGYYDPYDYILNVLKKPYKYPYKILQSKDDQMVYYKLADEFARINNSRGGNIILHSFEKGGHGQLGLNPVISGHFTWRGQKYPLTETAKEVAEYFHEYGGYPITF